MTPNHNFLLCLLFDLGYRGLSFALRANLESGPRFPKVWLQHFEFNLTSLVHYSNYHIIVNVSFCVLHKNKLYNATAKKHCIVRAQIPNIEICNPFEILTFRRSNMNGSNFESRLKSPFFDIFSHLTI